MSELRPVRSKASLIDRHLGGLTTLLLLAIGVAIVKPWGWFPGTGPGHPSTSGVAASAVAAVGTTPPPDL